MATATRPLEDFFAFLQCQLRMEMKQRFQSDVELQDNAALQIWEDFKNWVQPNASSKREKWVPFHTVLGFHELFAVETIHNANVKCWSERRRFLALFIFRAHCKSELFREVQLPFLKREDFWKDPGAGFADKGIVTKAMLEYRKRTREPMQTNAFRCIPARLVEDDDKNLVLNIARRTRTLLEVADKVYPIVRDSSKPASEKFDEISAEVQRGKGLGETWAKMLMVSMDLWYPQMGLLTKRCEVGTGAIGGLRRLLPGQQILSHSSGVPAPGGSGSAKNQLTPQEALEKVVAEANANPDQVSSAKRFWDLLHQVEKCACDTYRATPLVMEQMSTQQFGLTAATVQVQLCEWRQFCEHLEKADKVGGDPSGGGNRAALPPPLARQENPVEDEGRIADEYVETVLQTMAAPRRDRSRSRERIIGAPQKHREKEPPPPELTGPGMADLHKFECDLFQQHQEVGSVLEKLRQDRDKASSEVKEAQKECMAAHDESSSAEHELARIGHEISRAEQERSQWEEMVETLTRKEQESHLVLGMQMSVELAHEYITWDVLKKLPDTVQEQLAARKQAHQDPSRESCCHNREASVPSGGRTNGGLCNDRQTQRQEDLVNCVQSYHHNIREALDNLKTRIEEVDQRNACLLDQYERSVGEQEVVRSRWTEKKTQWEAKQKALSDAEELLTEADQKCSALSAERLKMPISVAGVKDLLKIP